MDSMVQGSIKEILVYSSAMVTFAQPWRPLSILFVVCQSVRFDSHVICPVKLLGRLCF
jgi:hypothetical protein